MTLVFLCERNGVKKENERRVQSEENNESKFIKIIYKENF